MEGRGVRAPLCTVIIGVVTLALVVAHTQVEAQELNCCRNKKGRECFETCRMAPFMCGRKCDCICVDKKAHSDVGGEEAQTHVMGYNVNCANTDAKVCFDKCRLTPELCAQRCVCTLTPPNNNINCPNTNAETCYNRCRLPKELCLKRCGCALGDITHYCKLGCASSVCKTVSAPRKTGAEDEVERCQNVCSEFCTKGANIAMVTD